VLAALGLVLAVLTGCGGDDDGGGGGGAATIDLADGLPSAAVCNGEPSDVNPPASDPASGYVYLSAGEDQGWTTGWFDTFGEQHAIVGDDATMILCVTVTESTEASRCPFEDGGETFELVMMEASYSLSLRNADTADEIGKGTASAPAEECPVSTSWTPGEGERQSFPAPTDGDLDDLIEVFFG
jgi:hypothetical protein